MLSVTCEGNIPEELNSLHDVDNIHAEISWSLPCRMVAGVGDRALA